MSHIEDANEALRLLNNMGSRRFKRENVVGGGPRRETMPSFRQIGTLADDLLALANDEVEKAIASGECDCEGDAYKISQQTKLKEHFGESYQQRLLQYALTDGLNERDYKRSISPLVNLLNERHPELGFFRARLAKLVPGAKADWHIDTNTSVYCRLQIMVRGQSMWSIKRAGIFVDQSMRAPEIWFANTGYAHRIINDGAGDRWVLILNADYDGIARTFGSLVEEAP
jgi:hypothetical protein